MAKYSAEQLRAMGGKGQAYKNPDGHFSFPIGDAEDLSNAIRAVGRSGPDVSNNAIRKYIIRRARALGKTDQIPDTWNSDGSLKGGGRSMTAPTPYTRAFALDDISIRAGGDGRTVDAYATVFDVPAHIRDQDGEYEEVNDRSMYNRAVADAAPAGGRTSWRVGVFYNHGMTIYQTPSDLYSMPVGVPLEIRPDGRGLFTRTRYVAGQLGDTIIDGIREGLLTTYSVSGAYLRSDPQVPRGGFRKGRDGQVPTVRRMEATLREYGPTPFPAYPEAEVVGMRAEWAALMLSNLAPGERERLAVMLRSSAPQDSLDVDASDDSGLVAEDSRHRSQVETRSGRPPKEELELQAARFILRQRERQAQRARSLIDQGVDSA